MKKPIFMFNWIISLAIAAMAISCTEYTQYRTGTDRMGFKDSAGTWQFMRNGEAYTIKGVYGQGNFEMLKKIGGNSIMLHHTELSDSILNLADSFGLTVSVTLDIGKARFEDNDYGDSIFIAAQRAWVKKTVQQYHSHPALLFWIIGNETHIMEKNNRALWSEINTLSEMIHQIDSVHLTTTTIAAYPTHSYQPLQVKLFAPDLDFLSLTIYESVNNFSRELQSFIWGYDGPILVAEWAGDPYWTCPSTEWGVFIEPNTTQNADRYAANYVQIFEQNSKQCFGGYVFYWGQKQERTHTVFSLLQDGKYKTGAVEKLQYFWKGDSIENWCPRIQQFELGENQITGLHYLNPGQDFPVKFAVQDPDIDSLRMKWEIRPEGEYSGKTGGEAEAHTQIVSASDSIVDYVPQFQITTPGKTGPYRIFAYVYDIAGNVASANIPFYVLPE